MIGFLRDRPADVPTIVVRIDPVRRSIGLEDLAAMAGLSDGPDFLLVPTAEEPAELALTANEVTIRASLASANHVAFAQVPL
ncbi:hypothetical protein [Novosphingobium sp.]|uniref:hypothetical protein n=1 Tax=Novosphingobium sp. TaxID=1874826 RepID=UPI0025F93049|nr:hypothetical protein [Novosphingobium sp.]